MKATVVLVGLFFLCSPSLGEDLALNRNDRFRYTDCDDVLQSGSYHESGIYEIYPNTSKPIKVLCQFEVDQASTIIMIQKYGRQSFVLPWRFYEDGFGDLSRGDFWLGLRGIKMLTDSGHRVLRVTMQDWGNKIIPLQYNYFALGSASSRYRLSIGSYRSGHILPDDFGHNNGMQFATFDRPDVNNCAVHQQAGWWYNYCTYVLPTGKYYPDGHYQPSGKFYDGIYYKDWHGFGYSLKYIKLELSRY